MKTRLIAGVSMVLVLFVLVLAAPKVVGALFFSALMATSLLFK